MVNLPDWFVILVFGLMHAFYRAFFETVLFYLFWNLLIVGILNGAALNFWFVFLVLYLVTAIKSNIKVYRLYYDLD